MQQLLGHSNPLCLKILKQIAHRQTQQVHRIFTPEQVTEYGHLIGDNNPIHQTNDRELDSTSFPDDKDKVIVHGMLTGSLFSSIFGTLIPGSIYRNQTMIFHSPIYCDESVVGRVRVKKIRDMKSRGVMVTCDTNVFKNCGDTTENIEDQDDAVVCISGEATVWLPGVSSANR